MPLSFLRRFLERKPRSPNAPSLFRTSYVVLPKGNYVPAVSELVKHGWWALSDLNGRPFGCKPNALTAELSALTLLIVQEAARSVNESATLPSPSFAGQVFEKSLDREHVLLFH